MARKPTTDPSAHLGFEATAKRASAFLHSEASPQVLSNAKNNMVALPGQLFYNTQIPVCLWFP